jgi:SagB-type dehydrogenase family enzyme
MDNMSRNRLLLIFLGILLLVLFAYFYIGKKAYKVGEKAEGIIELPNPKLKGKLSVEEALLIRRSIRKYSDEPLSLEEVSQLLWAGQGITAEWGGRTAPSAGATYPLTLYLVVEEVSGLEPGIYVYDPEDHVLVMRMKGSFRERLYEACIKQECVKLAPASIVIVARYERTTQRYGERGIRYVHIEVGCVVQNIYLQCASLDLATVCIGAFVDEDISSILGLEESEAPLIVMPVGHKP